MPFQDQLKVFRVSASVAFLLIAGSLQSQTGIPRYDSDPTVHDPSVIQVGQRFFVFGSHGASAWSDDLMKWTQVATSVYSGNPPHFSNFRSDLSELVEWTNANSLWAPDVIRLGDGRYYYYYCVWTSHYGYRSYMGLAVADTVEGPYTHSAEILRGGTGISGFNPAIHPNTIDPTVFYDADGRLQMVYGSYSGGIFIMEMDPETGLQLPGQEWGTHLWGGDHGRVEGPYIIHNPDTGYYYLFVSYYGLASQDGYNIRVARSRDPHGPYTDMRGADMTLARGSDAQIAPYGVKLLGGYRFASLPSEPGTSATGYLSPGHNSVSYDAERDKYFLFFHTRFLYRGEMHEVRVHQLYFNEDGWPVVAPHRYAGETRRAYTPRIVAGDWKVIDHSPMTLQANAKTSETITLNPDGTLSGSRSGTWSLENGRDIRLSLGGVAYRGVVSHQWDDDNKVWVLAFSALSGEGIALWGSQVAELRSSLETFRLIHFGSPENSGEGADTADPNGNGLSNLMEYALHLDPMAEGENTALSTHIKDSKLTIQFQRIGDPDLRYAVERSGDLADFSVIWSSSGNGNEIGSLSVSDNNNTTEFPGGFLRLKVSR
jgi:arabinan endo-1,5-alpha-L-arabinosidase